MRVDTGRLRVVSAEAGAAVEVPTAAQSSVGVARRLELGGAPKQDFEAEAEVADPFESPGPYIRAQRMQRGMSLDQLAIATKIPRSKLELLEADRYDELPGMVFTKGFLRCCARALELDEDTVLGLLYERERVQLRQRRRESSSVTPADPKQISKASPKKASKRRPTTLLDLGMDYVSGWISQLPSGRILMWIVVALLVALVVFIAFTLASSQAEPSMIRS